MDDTQLRTMLKECQEVLQPKGPLKQRDLIPFSFESDVPTSARVINRAKPEAAGKRSDTKNAGSSRPDAEQAGVKVRRRSQRDDAPAKAGPTPAGKKGRVKAISTSPPRQLATPPSAAAKPPRGASPHSAATSTGGFVYATVPAPTSVPPPLELMSLRQLAAGTAFLPLALPFSPPHSRPSVLVRV